MMGSLFLVAAAAIGLALGACSPAEVGPSQGADDMEQLKAAVLRGDPTAQLRARALGRSASPMLRDLAGNEDSRVRRIAIYCLMESGGPEATTAFLAALKDPDDQVAGAALRGLQGSPDPRWQVALFEGHDKTLHASVRGAIALLIGRLDKGADAAGLRKRWEAEKEPQAREGDTAALARLGLKEAQEEFVRGLHASQERARLRYLEHVRYIGASWLLKPLLPVLDDKTKLLNLNVDGLQEPPKDLRACDIAATRAATISGRKFSFKAEEYKIYSDAEIDEVRRFLKGLP